MLTTFLESLENAITFSNIHVLHPDIVTIGELKEIIYQLNNYHTENEILKINFHAWYSIAKTTCHFLKDRIIFALDIPIIYPETFDLYHLYPIPTKNNTILIPQKPYLALQQNIYQYMELPCEDIDGIHICTQEHLRTNPDRDCIPALILGQDPNCQPIPVHMPDEIFEKINENYVIIITRNSTKMREWCNGELQSTFTKGAKLLQVPTNCTVEIQNFKFGNIKTNSKGHPLLLPELDVEVTHRVSHAVNKLKIENIPLDEIHAIYRQTDAIKSVSLEQIEEVSSTNWILWTIVAILIIIILSYFGYKARGCYKKKTPALKLEVKEPMEASTPSVLFSPEVVS